MQRLTRTRIAGAMAAVLVLGIGTLVAIVLGKESVALALLGLLVLSLFPAIFEVGRRVREIRGDMRNLAKSRRDIGVLARSARRSLERSRRIQSDIQALISEESRSSLTQRRIIAAVETERLAASERQEAILSKIDQMRERLPTPQRGQDLFHDLRIFLPIVKIETIFDVGAHVRESAKELRSRLPHARMYSFERVGNTFLQLEAVAEDQRTRVFQVGLSDRDRAATMAVEGSDSAHVIPEDSGEAAQLKTLDSFCEQKGVLHIDFLKIHTEGHDLKVLQGSRKMLSSERIEIVQVEAGLSPENKLHVPLEALKAELEKHGYRLFGFYEQVGEGSSHTPQVRCTNAVFLAGGISSATPKQSPRGLRDSTAP